MKTFLTLLLLCCLTSCESGKQVIPPDGPDTPNRYDPEHGWKF